MLKMDDETREFLEKNVPRVLKCEALLDALDLLNDFINEKGFAPPDYEDYNELGDEAQRAYDNLRYYNLPYEKWAEDAVELPDNPNIDEEDRRKAARELSKYFDD